MQIKRLVVGKGRTTRPGDAAIVEDPGELEVAKANLTGLIDGWLSKSFKSPAQAEAQHIPQFNPEELLKHEWKGRKTGEGQYAKGSASFGWDFRDAFNEEVIKTLEKGPITIDQYQFTLAERIVQAKKKK
jgi:hypothetical protein